MTRYSNEHRDQIFVKEYRFLSFAKNTDKNTGKKLSRKYNQKRLDNANLCVIDALKTTSKRIIQKEQKQLVI